MSDSEIKVRNLQGDAYQVVKLSGLEDYTGYDEEEVLYQGSLTDCNAWLQLNDKGYFG